MIGGIMDWKTVRGTQPEKPSVTEIGKDYVFLRKNIHTYTETDPSDETKSVKGWEYQEMLITKAQYDDFVKITGNPFYVSDTDNIKSRVSNLETFIATSTAN